MCSNAFFLLRLLLPLLLYRLCSIDYMANPSSSSPAPFVRAPRPKRILIIGGGVAGLAALRALVEEGGTSAEGGPFESVGLVERRDNIGGVWYLNDDVVRQEKAFRGGTASGKWPVPGEGAKTHVNGSNGATPPRRRPFWPSPAYPALRGNVVPRFLSLAGAPPFPSFAHRDDPFPSLSETQEYLEQIAEPLRRYIRCNVECLGVWELPGRHEGENRWAVRTRDWSSIDEQGEVLDQTEYYDAVVLTVGWTDMPLFPRLSGLEEAKAVGIVEHCKWYRGPEPYGSTSRVVVVGNGNSGNDVAAQLAARRRQGEHEPVYRVARHKAWFFYVSLPDPMIKDVPALESMALTSDGKKVNITLVDGSVLENVDRVIFASGYEVGKFPSVHLLSRLPLPSEAPLLPSVEGTGERENSKWEAPSHDAAQSLWRPASSLAPGSPPFNMTDNPERVAQLYWQFLHARASTLAFVNLSVTSIPFWTSDLQSHCLRAIWDGSLTAFPSSLEERLQYETKRRQELARLKETEPERILTAQKKFIAEQANGNGAAYVPPEHTGAPPYHVLGTIVDDYGSALRSLAVSAKPEWESKLPHWPEHANERIGMYDLKRQTLEGKKRRGAQLV